MPIANANEPLKVSARSHSGSSHACCFLCVDAFTTLCIIMAPKRKAHASPLRVAGGVRQRIARRRVEVQCATGLTVGVGQQMCFALGSVLLSPEQNTSADQHPK